MGVDPEALAGVVGYALRGQALPRFSWNGREIPVRVRFTEEDRNSLDKLADFAVPSASGESVALSSLVVPQSLPSAQRIWRTDKRTSRSISLELAEEGEKETRERLNRFVSGIDLPEGISRQGAADDGPDEDLQNLLGALLFSVILIYLLMAFLFESFVLPLSIVVTMPLGFIGVAWAHVIAGLDIDFLGTVGLVLLIGVVVNNGIVLIDYVHRLRKAGHDRDEALVLAAHRRFRPIMMTALTTICGMMPLLSGGTTSIGMSYTSFGLTLVGGMTTATALTLLVIPVVYTQFDDLRAYCGALAARARGWRNRRGAVAVAGEDGT
jgi:HAE1 family hydrophobic/amphiphilic exporter-1